MRFRVLMQVLVAAGVLLSPVPVRAETVDVVVASIDFRVVALSLLANYRQVFAPSQPPAIALQMLIDDRLLANEARRYGQNLTPQAMKAAQARYPRPGDLTEVEWRLLLGDHELAKQFLEFRFSEFVPISRDELRAYYEANKAAYTQPFEEVEERIRTRLLPAARARQIEAYKAELRSRAQVRINAGLVPKE